MAGDMSEMQRRAAAIAVESIAALGAQLHHLHHQQQQQQHDTDGDSASSCSATATATATAHATRKSVHTAPASDAVALTPLKRIKLTMPVTPPTPTSIGATSSLLIVPSRLPEHEAATPPNWHAPRRSVGSESDGASSSAAEPHALAAGGEQQPAPARKVRVRKPTYAVRKEEKDVLTKEIQRLEAHVAFLKERAGLSAGRCASKLSESLHLNDAVREALRQQQLALARSQSAVLQCLSAQQTNPMSSYIRLGRTWHERRATLLALKAQKLRDAFEYVQARAQLLDQHSPHVTDERFETPNGDYCCVRFETIQFVNVPNGARQVFDALLHYLHRIEANISEHLGHVTVRESYDLVDASLSNHRLLSTEHGVELELNGVMFTEFEDHHSLAHGAPCGIVAVDSVDDDVVYPYASSGRVRKDIAATCVITETERPVRSSGAGGDDDTNRVERVVVLTRGAFLRLHASDVALTPQTQLEIRDGIARWGHAMIKCLNDMLYPEVADATQSTL